MEIRCTNPDCIITQNYDGFWEGEDTGWFTPCPFCFITFNKNEGGDLK